MISFLSKNNSSSNLINFLFLLIPASYVAGNTILNSNIFLLIAATIIIYGRKIFKVNFFFLDKIILCLFSFIVVVGIYNFINLQFFEVEQKYSFSINVGVLIKTISYVRYLLLYFILRFLIENKIINFKLFFISCSIFSLFVGLDVIYQFIFGKDIFGYEPSLGRKFAGPFGKEYIAGGYIQRFCLFSFFLLPVFFKIKNRNLLYFFIIILFLIYFVSIVLTGNRMPLILFIFMFFLIILLEKKIRKYFFYFLTTAVIILTMLFNSNNLIKSNFTNLFKQIYSVSKIFTHNELGNSSFNSYFMEFKTFHGTWQMNKFVGGGVKSFRINCWKRKNIVPGERTTCNTHPHNYYLEILTDLGLIGFLIFSSIFATVLYFSFVKKYFLSSALTNNHVVTPFMFLFLMEIFPIKISGSFFTTTNSTFIFLTLAVIVGILRKENLN